MADELTLPALAQNPVIESLPAHRLHKRVRLSSPPISSDPAIFSSDDDPSAENYTQGRQKQTYTGPWYSQQPASDQYSQEVHERGNPKKVKRTFERQFDSGVWLESDGTDLDEAANSIDSASGPWKLPVRQSRATQTSKDGPPSTEELARGQIELCLEEGNESIDLSSRGLEVLSNVTIRPLVAFSCVPPVTEGVFSRIEPMLKVFLSSNNLKTLPEELFNLDRLTVLSIRGNRIYELPAGVGKLRNLLELNISQNKMQFLPFEILDLFSDGCRLQSFTIHPNPFHQPLYLDKEMQPVDENPPFKIGLGNCDRPRRGAVCCVSQDERRRSWHSQWRISYEARTKVRFLDINGSHLQGPTFSNHTLFGPAKFLGGIPVAEVGDTPNPPTPRGAHLSRAPSLLEIALTACSRTPQLPYLQSMLPDPCPAYFPGLLETVAAKKESGSTKCTICKRNFIVPRTEWIEWWQIKKSEKKGMASAASPLREMENERDKLESMVPLMRRGCSWLCVPGKVVVERKEDRMAV